MFKEGTKFINPETGSFKYVIVRNDPDPLYCWYRILSKDGEPKGSSYRVAVADITADIDEGAAIPVGGL